MPVLPSSSSNGLSNQLLSAIIGEKAEAEGVSAKNLPNSQTIALLEASAAVDQSDVDATDGVSEDGLALVPELVLLLPWQM